MTIQTTERYCPVCGKVVTEATWNRFGEWCCSEAHAGEYVAEVRTQKQRQLATTGAAPSEQTRERRSGGCC